MGSAAGGGEVVPTEDAVQALLDCLVEPIIPHKSSENDPSNASLQQSLATQMHAVVLLYNFYHRKQFPQLEFLDCDSFCKVAANAKPSLLVHLSYMQKSSEQMKNLTTVEKAILTACNISIGLDTMKYAPSMEAWPISKIAVLLTDSTKQKCSLYFSERTEGVWSLIEKHKSECNDIQEGFLGRTNKGKNIPSKWPVNVLSGDNGTRMQHIAMSAVQERTGINPTELTILESHITYSLSEEKSTACFFIMQSTAVNKGIFDVPIKDAIESLQGPLIKKSCNSYIAADIVEYFHLLPYAGIITNWLSRELLPNGSAPLREENAIMNFTLWNDEPVTAPSTTKSERSPGSCEATDFAKPKANNIKDMKDKENSDYQVNRLQNTDKDKSPTTYPNKKRKTTSTVLFGNVVKHLSTQDDLRSTKSGSTSEDLVAAGVDVPIEVALPSEQALVVSDTEYLDCMMPCSPGDIEYLDGVSPRSSGGAGKITGGSYGGKHDVISWHGPMMHNVDILKPIASINGEGDGAYEVMLKEVANINIPSNNNPDKPLSSSDKLLLTEAVVKVLNFSPDQTSTTIKELHSCKNWGETKVIRDEILNRKNDLLGLSKEQQLVCSRDASSETNVEVCSNGGVVSVGSISFSEQYMKLYKRIVARFGDIIMPESKEAKLFDDMVSTAMKGLFEVVESMLQASPRSINPVMIESWEMKIRFCKFAGLKVGWLHDHLERIKMASVSSDCALVQELEGRLSSVTESLEAVRRRAVDVKKELELVQNEEKVLLEEKAAVDADLETAKLRQELFPFSLF